MHAWCSSRVMQHYRMIHSYAYKGFNFDFHSVSSEYWFFFSLDQLRFRYYSCIGWSTAIHTEVPVLNMFQLNSVFRVSPSQLYVTFIRWLHKIHKRRYFFPSQPQLLLSLRFGRLSSFAVFWPVQAGGPWLGGDDRVHGERGGLGRVHAFLVRESLQHKVMCCFSPLFGFY